MTVFTNNQGTTLRAFRIGISGPTIYTGTADPTVSPPTPIADGLKDGDIYIRNSSGAAGIWVRDSSTFTPIATGGGGGSFAGDVTMLTSAQLFLDETAVAGAPSLAFDGDPDTGIFQGSSNEVSIATGGLKRFGFESDGTLASTTAGYESLVLSDNDIPNKKYVDDTFLDVAGDTMIGDLDFTGTAQVRLADGSAANPALTFVSDPDTGIMSGGAGDMAFVADGVGIMEIGSEGAFMLGAAQFIAAINSATAPGYSFVGDLDTGLFSNVAGQTAISSNGTETIRFGATAATGTLLWRGGDGTVGAPGMSFGSDIDTGFYRSASGVVGFASNGVAAMSIGAETLFRDGSAALPSISFINDVDSGMYSSGSNEVSIGTVGTQRFTVESDGTLNVAGTANYETLVTDDDDIPNKKYVDDSTVSVTGDTMTGSLSMTGVSQVVGYATGSFAIPQFTFLGDLDTGMLSGTPGSVSFTSNGAYVGGFNASRFDLDVPVHTLSGTPAAPTYSFDADPDTGMYRSAANTLGFTTGGVSRWLVQADGAFEPVLDNTYDIGDALLRVATVYATTFDGTATAAQYSDLAERYTVGNCCELKPGDVVCICNHEDHDICKCDHEADDRVLGVVSTAPGFRMNKDAGSDKTAPYIALRGRVPVKVCGNVKKGDLLISCKTAGCARALTTAEKHAISPHAVFAKALSTNKDGVCEAVIL